MVNNLEEFETALKLLIKEKSGTLNLSKLCLSSEEGHRYFSEIKEEFCNRYKFTEELFDVALEGWYAKSDVKQIENMLKDPKYRTAKNYKEE